MTPAQILALIQAQITSNGIGAITGPIMSNILTQIVNLFIGPQAAARIISTSTPIAVLLSDVYIGILRTINLAPTTVNLPAGAAVGQPFIIQDLNGNFNAFPVTVVPPVGMTIAGLANFVLDQDRQSARLVFYGQNIWGIET